MNEPESIDTTTHNQAMLLPWYLADTLDRQEKLDVEAHVSQCKACQKELDEMRHTQAAVKAAVSEREGPSPAVLTQVMTRIREEKESAATISATVPHESQSIWNHIQEWLQSVFAVPWVPVLATLLIVGQSALLLTNYGGSPGTIDRSPVISRGIPQATSPSTSSQLHVIFAETATQHEIQSLLQRIHGQIIGGPSADGTYILQIPTNAPTKIEMSLEALRSQHTIVRSATSQRP